MSALKATILIVEDDHDIRVMLRELLEGDGYFVISAANGASALLLLDQISRPSLVLLDLNMPIMGGEEFLAKLKSLPSHASIPVIIISANRQPCPEGAVCFLKKPIDLDALTHTVRSVISNTPVQPLRVSTAR